MSWFPFHTCRCCLLKLWRFVDFPNGTPMESWFNDTGEQSSCSWIRYISEIKQCNLNCEVDDDKNDEQELYGLISSIKIKGTARQLTTAYAPQQNRVVEHKDRTVIEMARLVFWAEAMCIDSYVSIFLICVQ